MFSMIAAAILDISCRKPLHSPENCPFHFQTNPMMYRIFPYRTYGFLIIYAEGSSEGAIFCAPLKERGYMLYLFQLVGDIQNVINLWPNSDTRLP